jgi:uncharacterized membrane protein YGL010W
MMGDKTSQEWIQQYALSHQHTVNRLCHTIGIPLIAASLLLFMLGFVVAGLWLVAAALFILGWMLQFVGHGFEGKPPEFFRDWRFLLVGLRWWVAKVSGRI